MRIIAVNPKLRAEAQALLPQLERAKEAATSEEIVAIVMREMPAWGVSAKAAGEFGVTYASYAEALDGLPLWAVEEAVIKWNRAEGHRDLSMGGFPPRPAQLYALAMESKATLYMAAYRCKLALEYVEQSIPRLSEAERQERAGQLRDLLGELGRRRKEMPQLQRPRIDQHRMAEQLRARAAERDQDVGEVL